MINKRTIFAVLAALIAVSLFATARAQQISIADPGLDAAIRETLQKPTGPLTEQDLLELTNLNASGRGVSNLAGLDGAHNLTVLDLQFNQLANLSFPSGLTNLSVLDLQFNQLTNLTLPAGLAQLDSLDVSDNQLVSLTLPPDMTNLSSLFLDLNPLTTLVLSEPLAATNLAELVADLKARNVSVFIYPPAPKLVAPRLPGDGSFQFAVTGPPGVYAIFASRDLAAWNKFAALTNQLGVARFADGSARLSPQKFYRAVLTP